MSKSVVLTKTQYMENTVYKPFAFIEQYTPVEGTTVYYNTKKTLATQKNDCHIGGTTGNSVELTAEANKFVSTISIADANEQAESWLKANAQAYANNSGSCLIRQTAWRGVDHSCVIEPSRLLLPFDYMIIRYKWVLGAGQDLDTFTGFVNTGTQYDKQWLGHGQGRTKLPSTTIEAKDSYIMWAGDNQETVGVESCFVNFTKMASDHASLNTIQIRMAAAWYKQIGTGNIDIEIAIYSGGEISASGNDFINTGGAIVQKLNFSKNIPSPPTWSNNIENVPHIGYITYTTHTKKAQIAITY
ncbi:DUF5977 domain-containing protein [Flavobacterium sp. FlaQc-52]|jgi:hypothetical protein|uniref:DUF5977 domain-containing protein n=1 Tax=Flavobacterium sp. FlaQc-52 TaxID=3374185 RepID=UPI0037581A9A